MQAKMKLIDLVTSSTLSVNQIDIAGVPLAWNFMQDLFDKSHPPLTLQSTFKGWKGDPSAGIGKAL